MINTYFIPQKITLPSFEGLVERQIFQKAGKNKYHVILEFDFQDKEFLIQTLGALNFKTTENKGVIDFQTTNIEYTANLILSLQDKVKVISPPELYERVLSTICKMKMLYER